MPTKAQTPPPAYFLSLSLENVRSFGEKQTIYFTEGGKPDGRPAQWTIILGDNGVGKTTVLKSLAVLMPIEEITSEKGEVYYQPELVGYMNFRWQPKRYGSKLKAYLLGEIGAGFEFSKKGEKPLISNVSIGYAVDDRFATDSQGVDENFRGLICYGYGAGRITGESTLAEIEEMDAVGTCFSLFDDRADLLNPEEWFLQMEYTSLREENQAKRVTTLLERIKQALLQLLPDVTDIQIKSTEKHRQQLKLLTPYGWVRLRDMSLGYQTLVVWLTDFASKLFIRYPDSPNPLEEPAIVLIDEIDLHLHPSWQRKLIGFLSGIFKNTQFIATAHSPLVVQAAGDAGANVVVLRREGDQTIVDQNLPDVRRWRVDQILNSELFEDTSALSSQTEEELQRRNTLLLKKRLTAKEKAELENLNAKAAAQPVGDTPAERKVENLLARLARNLKEDDLLQ